MWGVTAPLLQQKKRILHTTSALLASRFCENLRNKTVLGGLTFCSASCCSGVRGGRPSFEAVLCPFSIIRASPPCRHTSVWLWWQGGNTHYISLPETPKSNLCKSLLRKDRDGWTNKYKQANYVWPTPTPKLKYDPRLPSGRLNNECS